MICPNKHIGRLGLFERLHAQASVDRRKIDILRFTTNGDRNSGKYDCMYGRTTIWFRRSEINVTECHFGSTATGKYAVGIICDFANAYSYRMDCKSL